MLFEGGYIVNAYFKRVVIGSFCVMQLFASIQAIVVNFEEKEPEYFANTKTWHEIAAEICNGSELAAQSLCFSITRKDKVLLTICMGRSSWWHQPISKCLESPLLNSFYSSDLTINAFILTQSDDVIQWTREFFKDQDRMSAERPTTTSAHQETQIPVIVEAVRIVVPTSPQPVPAPARLIQEPTRPIVAPNPVNVQSLQKLDVNIIFKMLGQNPQNHDICQAIFDKLCIMQKRFGFLLMKSRLEECFEMYVLTEDDWIDFIAWLTTLPQSTIRDDIIQFIEKCISSPFEFSKLISNCRELLQRNSQVLDYGLFMDNLSLMDIGRFKSFARVTSKLYMPLVNKLEEKLGQANAMRFAVLLTSKKMQDSSDFSHAEKEAFKNFAEVLERKR